METSNLPTGTESSQASSRAEWLATCAESLHAHWPGVDRDGLDNIAEALYKEARWRDSDPIDASERWIAQATRQARSPLASLAGKRSAF